MVDTDGGSRRTRAAALAALHASEARRTRRPLAIFLTENSRVIVQGMTGSEGCNRPSGTHAAKGTTIVGGVTPSKGGQSVDFGGTAQCRSSPALSESDRTRPVQTLSPSCSCHRGWPESDGHGSHRRRHSAHRRHHRRRTGAGHRRVLRVRAIRGRFADRRPDCQGLISPGKSTPALVRAEASDRPAGSAWCWNQGGLTYQMI